MDSMGWHRRGAGARGTLVAVGSKRLSMAEDWGRVECSTENPRCARASGFTAKRRHVGPLGVGPAPRRTIL